MQMWKKKENVNSNKRIQATVTSLYLDDTELKYVFDINRQILH